MEENTVKISHILFMILMMGIIIIVGTYAWLSYRSNDTAMVLTIGEINNVQVTLSPYQIKASLLPQVTYTSDNYTSVTAINNSTIARDIELYYKINSIDNELISSDFKYTIERSTNGTTYSEYKTGNFSSATNGGELTILEESIPSSTTYYYKVYLWIDGSNSGQSYMQGKSFNGELRANVEQDTYTVTFDEGNIYYVSNTNFNGLEISYDENTQILTLNGQSTSTNSGVYLDRFNSNFIEGDAYKVTLTHISGSFSGSGYVAIEMDIRNSSNSNVSPRNNIGAYISNSGIVTNTASISNSGAEQGTQYCYWIWFQGGASNYSFNDYKIKVNYSKVPETKQVTYGYPYGDLPTPTRTGYTFKGWINGIEVPSKTGGAWVTELVNNSFVTSNFETGKKYKLEYDVTLNETIPNGWNAGWTSQWGNIGLRTGTNPYTYLIANATGVLYSLCGSTYSIGDNYHITGNITMPADISTGILVYYTGLCGNSSDSSARYRINATFSNIIFYDYDDPYGNVNSNTIVQIPNNHTLKAMWQEN